MSENLYMFYQDDKGDYRILPLPAGFTKIIAIHPESVCKQMLRSLEKLVPENADKWS